MADQSFDVAVVGHFSIDTIILPSRSKPFVVLGGAVAYASLTTKHLDGTASVLSRVGADFPEAYMWWLRDEGIDLSGVVKVADEKTTRFELTYNADLSSRILKLKSKGSPIVLGDVASSLHAKATHIAPIAREVPYEVVEHLKGCCDVLSIDPQGMSRNFDEYGNVTCNAQIDNNLLSLINVYKSSQEEICVLTGKSDVNSAIKAVHDFGPEIVIVTMGAKGALLSEQGSLVKIPACASEKVVDPTGAGDVFIGGFLTEYTRQNDLFWCACVGSAAASLAVECVGPTFLGEKEEIYRRASCAYEKNKQN
jgi:sugar/nucleoside kinase (ribokinase family)